MFVCRRARGLKPKGAFNVHVNASGSVDATCALRNKHQHGFPRFWGGCGKNGYDDIRSHGRRQESNPFVLNSWDCNRLTPYRKPLCYVDLTLFLSPQGNRKPSYTDSTLFCDRVKRFNTLDAVESVLFSSGAHVCAIRHPTSYVQMRFSSSTPATQKREADSTDAQLKVERSPETQPEEAKPTKVQQLKNVFKQYGAVGVSFHVGISLMSLGACYLAVSSGIDMAAVLAKLGFSESLVRSKIASGTSTFVLAYAVHKLFAPVRISITLVCVPLIVRYLRKTGLFKPPVSGS